MLHDRVRRFGRAGLSFSLTAIVVALVIVAPAQASDGTWASAWGKDVDAVAGGTGAEICTVAANCKAAVAGTLGGEMDGAAGVATDAAGNVYAADFSNNRIQKFDSSGNFLRAWGQDVDAVAVGTGFEICTVAANCKAGATMGFARGGELHAPNGVATESSGNVYVVDGLRGRIQKFDSSGNFLRAWGKDVDSVAVGTDFEICTVAADCKGGDPGDLGGELFTPKGIATDSADKVYVTDGLNRIQKRI